jgi:heme-degrading monooxygenase HmoA
MEGSQMSVLVIARLKVDPAKFQDLVARRGGEMPAISQKGKAAGAIHHQFVAGDGEVLIVDEWDEAEHFSAFFSGQPEIADLMADGGVEGPPDVSIYRVIDTPDRF